MFRTGNVVFFFVQPDKVDGIEAQRRLMLLTAVRYALQELPAGYPDAASIEQLKNECYNRLMRTLDRHRSGYLNREEVKRFLQLAVVPMLYPRHADLDTVTQDRWNNLDWDKDGRCDAAEFRQGMEVLRVDFSLSEIQMIGLIVGVFLPLVS